MDGGIDVKIGANAEIINFSLQNGDGNIEVSIIDSKGYKLYKEKFQGGFYAKKFDFSALPNGDYFFEIEGQTRIKTVPFSVVLNSVKFNSKSIYYKPIVRMKNDEIIISKMALSNEYLEIDLLDKNSNLLYTEKLNGKINLDRALDISELIEGDYKLVMKSENRIFKKIINKKNWY